MKLIYPLSFFSCSLFVASPILSHCAAIYAGAVEKWA